MNRFVTSNKESQSPILEEDVQKEREREKPEDEVVVVDEVEDVVEEVERNIPEKRIENELEQAIQSVVEKQPKEKKTRKRTKEGVVISTDNRKVDLSLAKIGDQLIKDRLPPPSKYSVPISSYYLNNRKIYISNLAKLFRPYSNKILAKSDQLSCKTLHSENIDFGLLTHQLVVRDYLNLYTPYRGLLLYHGLGSGKTCTSIGIAEGMKSEKQVILMTPASLKTNFFNELKKCGDALYKKNQYWEFISIEEDPQRVSLLSQVLGVDVEYIRKNKGAWLMNVKKGPNFADLSDKDQKSVDQQIDHMIRNKYMDINYNGLQKKHLDEMTKNGKVNPFDNKVVIIDEVHNLVSNIANSGNKKGTKAYVLYRALMDATNTKIVFLTGTPIINVPREIAILFNMLRGYIKTWTFSLETTTNDKINTEILVDSFRKEGLTMYDYVEYTTNKLVITRNPFGFVNMYNRGEKDKKGGNKQTKRKTSSNIRKTKKSFFPFFTSGRNDDSQSSHSNPFISTRYAGALNEFQKNTGGGAMEDYAGVHLDEQGNISDHVFETRLTNILIHHGIRIVGKPKIKKETCLPDDEDVFNEMFINGEKGELMNNDIFKRRVLGLTSYFRSAQEQLLPSFVKTSDGSNYNIVNVNMSDYQFEEYEKVRKDERNEEKSRKKKNKKNKELEEEFASSYRIYSRSACNFVFPGEHKRPRVYGKENIDFDELDVITNDQRKSQDDYFEEEEEPEKLKETEETSYQEQIQKAYEFLKYDPSKRRSTEYLTEEGLQIYSPKFREILHNITKEGHKGNHLVYSQFRTLEGIGLFKMVLEANGFLEFKVVKKGSQWEIMDWEKDPEKPRFTLYTGTETSEEKDIVRNVYNGSWNLVPPSIVDKLRERNENNLYGEVIKVFMITASGAEGINLRNTRYVHIMEPYWNMVRVDQVVGRARRICSHEDLPENMRTVEVFIYLSNATSEQIDKNIELKVNDLSKLPYKIHDEKKGRDITERVPFTTDQYLLEIAQMKDSITRQILTSVKETAIDCSLYNTNPAEPLVCYGFGRVQPQSFASYPTLERDAQEKPATRTETKRTLVAVTIEGVKYALDKRTMSVYDYASYEKAKDKKGELQEIGKLDMKTKTIKFS